MKAIALTLLCCTLLIPSVSCAAELWEQWDLNTDRPGYDYRDYQLSQPDPGLCQRDCHADINCKAWSYVRPNITGPGAHCWLKSAVSSAFRNPDCISGVKANARRAGTMKGPQAQTGYASQVGTTSAKLNGWVASEGGFTTSLYFEWGETIAYGNNTTSDTLIQPGQSTATLVSSQLSNLKPSTLYHYRLVARNSVGRSEGADLTFTTQGPAPAPTPTPTPAPPKPAPAAKTLEQRVADLEAKVKQQEERLRKCCP
jgi:hypothetical protein